VNIYYHLLIFLPLITSKIYEHALYLHQQKEAKNLKLTTLIFVLILIGGIIGTSGCTINTNQTPENGKYNTINPTTGDDVIWNTNTCPFCGTEKPKPKNKLIKLLPIIALDADMNFLQLENIKKMICEDGKV